ncbi:MAG TPA: hypothetical protein ENH70_06935 [Desulfobacteraceae bacterium]|nr:hypothetical protein [Desulfobacteraceae bacterium]
MANILSTYEGMPTGYRKVFIRMLGVERDKLPHLEDDLRKKATLLYVVDHRENRREIFYRKMHGDLDVIKESI